MKRARRSKKIRGKRECEDGSFSCLPGNTTYFWDEDENMRYRGFLRDYMGMLTKNTEERRSLKVNVRMSRYVRSRTTKQCRSHHQKMLKHHGSIAGILEYFSEKECKEKVSEAGTMIERDEKTKKGDYLIGGVMEIKEVNEGMPSFWDQMIAESWGYIS